MPNQYADYPGRSQNLLSAGRLLLVSFKDEAINRNIVIQDIESAAQISHPSDFIFRFGPATGNEPDLLPEGSTPADALSELLFQFQSANVLMSSGIALNEHGNGSELTLLNRSLQELAISEASVRQDLQAHAKLEFAPAQAVKSASLDQAKEAFRVNANEVLKRIVEDTVPVVNDLFEQLKKLDGTKVLEAIDELGKSFESIAAAGNMIRQGAEKLKNALEVLAKLLGSELLDRIKGKIQELWQKFQEGEHTRDLLNWAFGVEGVEKRIEEALAKPGVDLNEFDHAANELSALYSRYGSTLKLLRALVSAIALAGGIIAVLHLAAPAVPLAMAGSYAVLIATTVLVGMDYCDSGWLLGWVRGVGEIAGGIRPAGSGNP